MHADLLATLRALEPAMAAIPTDRKNLLDQLAGYIRHRLAEGHPARLQFICTHNSRRSHLAQIWAAVAARHHGLDRVETHSAGTEATAFNPRAITALRQAGLRIPDPATPDPADPDADNPRYHVEYDPAAPPLVCHSKTLDHPSAPSAPFAAIMTCSDADEHCPIVPGAEFRLSLPYRDPKESDGTPHESHIYDQRSRQIATEMLFAMATAAAHTP